MPWVWWLCHLLTYPLKLGEHVVNMVTRWFNNSGYQNYEAVDAANMPRAHLPQPSKLSKFLGQLLRSSGSDWHQQQHVGYVVNCPKIIHGATTTKWPMDAKLNPQGRVDSKQVMRWSWDDPKWCPRWKKKKWVTDVGRFGWKRLEWIF